MAERILLVNPLRRHKRRRVNPSKRGHKTRVRKMARRAYRMTPARRRAIRHLIAFNRRRRRGHSVAHNPRRRVHHRRRRRNPISTAAAYRSLPTMTGTAMNPRRRRRRRHHYGMNPIHRRRYHRRRHHNPLRLGRGSKMTGLFKAAVPAAFGAIALDVMFGYVSPHLPAGVTGGTMKVVSKSLGAIALTWLAEKVVSRHTAEAMGVGALTVVFHDTLKTMIASAMPTLKMDGMGYYSAGYPAGGIAGMGVYVGAGGSQAAGLPMAGMGEYVSGMSHYDTESSYYR